MSPDQGEICIDRLWKRFRADQAMATAAWARNRFRRRGPATDDGRWALRDVSAQIGAGEAVGIVGVNGSGKSTLLKILTGTMDPTAGRVSVTGRVGALIELQAGLHPELTGRENVRAYGALMGLSRRQAAAIVTPVIEEAGVPDAADRQVKFYSTGMRLRLGFTIAAHLDAPVLLVDEVLAVADAEFQRACLDRIGRLHRDGKTVVVVSHDLAVIEATTDRVLWIDRGRLVADGAVAATLAAYRGARQEPQLELEARAEGVRLAGVRVHGPDGDASLSGGPLSVELHLSCARATAGMLRFGIGPADGDPLLIVERREALPVGSTTATCHLEALPLAGGSYHLWVGMDVAGVSVVAWQPRSGFEVHGPRPAPSGLPLAVSTSWEVTAG